MKATKSIAKECPFEISVYIKQCSIECALFDEDRKQCCFMTIAKVLVNRGL